jgi:hypothetical protein
VTVPFSYLGELPKELASVPQLEIILEAYNKPVSLGPPADILADKQNPKSEITTLAVGTTPRQEDDLDD